MSGSARVIKTKSEYKEISYCISVVLHELDTRVC